MESLRGRESVECSKIGRGRRSRHNIRYLVTTFQIRPSREVLGATLRVSRRPVEVLRRGLKLPEDTEEKVSCGGPRMRGGVERMMTDTFTVGVDGEVSVGVRAANRVTKFAR